jgi:hypothetical protein
MSKANLVMELLALLVLMALMCLDVAINQKQHLLNGFHMFWRSVKMPAYVTTTLESLVMQFVGIRIIKYYIILRDAKLKPSYNKPFMYT